MRIMNGIDDVRAEYQPAPGQKELYGESYFTFRQNNDQRRLQQFRLEAELLRKYVASGRILDVGCSTGEFLQTIRWQGEMYGMEISAFARSHAEARGIRFDRDVFNAIDFFDCVVFRGTIQHLDEPFRFIKYAYRALRPGGYVFFLATPNVNSIVYRRKQTLPLIDFPRSFYLPDDVSLPNALRNFSFHVEEIRYPYRGTPYCNFWSDHIRFVRNLVSTRYIPHAFWRNSMEIVARKPQTVDTR